MPKQFFLKSIFWNPFGRDGKGVWVVRETTPGGYLFMLGRLVACKIIYVRSVGSPENT